MTAEADSAATFRVARVSAALRILGCDDRLVAKSIGVVAADLPPAESVLRACTAREIIDVYGRLDKRQPLGRVQHVMTLSEMAVSCAWLASPAGASLVPTAMQRVSMYIAGSAVLSELRQMDECLADAAKGSPGDPVIAVARLAIVQALGACGGAAVIFDPRALETAHDLIELRSEQASVIARADATEAELGRAAARAERAEASMMAALDRHMTRWLATHLGHFVAVSSGSAS